MSPAAAAFVAVRLLAVYWAVRSLEAWGQLLVLVVPDMPWDDVNRSSVAVASAIPGALQGIAAIALWFAARRAANAIAGNAKPGEPGDGGGSTPGGWETAALAVAGLVVAVTALPDLAGTLYMMAQPAAYGFEFSVYQRSEFRAELIEGAARTLLGLVLAFGARPVASMLRRTAGRRE